MHRLGYTRYVAQGGDVGALVTDLMGRQASRGLGRLPPEPAHGGARHRRSPAQGIPLRTPRGRGVRDSSGSGFGYFLEMATRPQTIGYALLDSPVALAAWMLDHDTDSYTKISTAFVDGEPVGNLTRDTILDNITLYWLTGTAASAARSSGRDARALAAWLASGQPPPAVSVPVGFTTFPGEIWATPRSSAPGGLPRPRLLQLGRQGRALRRLGRARALLGRGAGCVQVAPLATTRSSGTLRTPPDLARTCVVDVSSQPGRRAFGSTSSRRPHPARALRGALTAGQLPARPDEVARVAVRVALQVVLVLRLRLPERARRLHLGDDLARPQARRLDVGDRVLGDPRCSSDV